MEIREVGVVGLGTMGAGIAEVFARGGLAVTVVEADRAALDRGLAILAASLDKAVARGKLGRDDRELMLRRVRPGGSLDSLAGADLIVEVVPEQLAIKREIIAGLDLACRPDAVIATNTSSLSVTAIAAGSARPGRVVGMHFFNPAPVMRLVEVVTTVLTEPGIGEAITGLASRLGKTPVRVLDRAGFVANALLLPYLNHAAALLGSGYATREDIDTAATAGLGLPMGPLALLDLIGLDTSLAILEVLDREFGGTRYTPAPLLRRMAEAGRTGRKSGVGFYEYAASPGRPADDQVSTLNEELPPAPGTVLLVGGGVGQDDGLATGLAGLITAAGIGVHHDPALPADLVVVATGQEGGVLRAALAAGRAGDAVGLHRTAPDLLEVVTTQATGENAVAAASALAARLGIRAVRSPDRPGLLAGTLLYPHLRDAAVMIADGYASPADVDAAMTLGCGYPRGPARMIDDAGARRVVTVLAAMHSAWGDPAYALPPLLADLALLGSPLTAPGSPVVARSQEAGSPVVARPQEAGSPDVARPQAPGSPVVARPPEADRADRTA